MRKYWVNIVKSAFGLLAASTLLVSCTDTDENLGNSSYLPFGGELTTYFHSIDSGFEISTVTIDSIATSNLSSSPLGTWIRPEYGLVQFGFVGQVLPDPYFSFVRDREPFGESPVVDSIHFTIRANSHYADSENRYDVTVYELNKPLPYPIDSTYFSNFDVEKYINPTPFAHINVAPGDYIDIPLTGASYEKAKRVMSLSADELKDDDYMRSLFNGFYIKTSSSQSNSNLQYINTDVSGLTIYYHNQEKEPDTTYFSVNFHRTETTIYYTTERKNIAFTTIDHDYTLKNPAQGIHFEEDVTSEISYVTGLGGVMTKFTIPDSIIDELKAEVKAKGGSKIVVTNATLTVPNGNSSLDALDNFISLGMYKNYQPIRGMVVSSATNYEFYDGENVLNDYSDIVGTLSLFGGVLNRSTNQYQMTISTLVQALVNGTSETNTVEIAPGYLETMAFGISYLENSTANPISLELIYSVI